MRNALLVLCMSFAVNTSFAEKRFDRPVIKVADPNMYQFHKLDDVDYPTLSNQKYEVSCLVYRGTENYYVEVTIRNTSAAAVAVPLEFLAFEKSGYTVHRIDSIPAAREFASLAGERFVPVPPPYVPPTYNTTINATATTYGNQTQVNGTATTSADYSGQAGANLGNAIGNAIAAHRFRKEQRNLASFSSFIASHVQTSFDTPLAPGQSRTILATFSQPKAKKRPFNVDIRLNGDVFHFAYKE
jgi:hypothetical protein